MFRFVVSIDVPGDTLKDSYRTLFEKLNELGLEWESTDEAFDADGDEVPEYALNDARIAIITEKDEEEGS